MKLVVNMKDINYIKMEISDLGQNTYYGSLIFCFSPCALKWKEKSSAFSSAR